jgi:membrane protease YdiL (CAAX protease family)
MYLKQAKEGYTGWWRYVVILLIVITLNFIAGVPLLIVSTIKTLSGQANMSEFVSTYNPEALGLSKNMGLLILVAPLSIVFIGLAVIIKYLFGYSWTKVFTSYAHFRWKNFFLTAGIWFILLVAADMAYYFIAPSAYTLHFDPSAFYTLLLICLIFIPLQSAWEELYFRGNLMQGIGLLLRSRWKALIITSVTFGSMHLANPEVQKYGVTSAMIQYIGFGLLLGITVIMDGGLEMAFGLHAVNNIYATVFVSYSGSVLNTPSLISSEQDNTTYMAIAFLVASAIFLLVAKSVFKWKSFRWLFEPIRD